MEHHHQQMMQHGQPTFLLPHSNNGGMGVIGDNKVFSNHLIGQLNLTPNGIVPLHHSHSHTNGNNIGAGMQNSVGNYPYQNLMLPMSMVERTSVTSPEKAKREVERHSPLTSSSDGSSETDNETPPSWGQNGNNRHQNQGGQQGQQGQGQAAQKKPKQRRNTKNTILTYTGPVPENGSLGEGRRRVGRPSQSEDGERPFACDQCPKRFAQKAGLIQHERRHSGERPFACAHCDKKFTQKSGLVQHERLHTGDKPYECPECDKKFTQKSGLVQHVRTHTGEKPYKCQLCGKCFTQLSGLKQHGKVHGKS